VKASLRWLYLEKRDQLTDAEVAVRSQAIVQRLYQMPEYQAAKLVFSYVTHSHEVDTRGIITDLIYATDRQVAVPLCNPADKTMTASIVNKWDELRQGLFGVWEPKKNHVRIVDPHELNVALVPGIVFDKRGYRIGHGQGYYDRFLGQYRTNMISIGLSFDIQVIDEIPVSMHDMPVNYIVTETQVYKCVQ
jgi:5-formyltetrahydrofolate cyclo-ligase